MDYIAQLWEKHLDPILSPLWDSLVLWRTIALAFLTFVVLGFLYRDKILAFFFRQKHQEHDRDVFARLDKVLSEQQIQNILFTLESNHQSNSDGFYQIIEFESFYDLEANRFLNAKIDVATKKLSKATAQLTEFISLNFFTLGNSTNRTYLYPDLNIDRGGDGSPEQRSKYEQYRLELCNLIKQVRVSYKSFRALIKQRLLQ